jgi:formyl-CoA transferase
VKARPQASAKKVVNVRSQKPPTPAVCRSLTSHGAAGKALDDQDPRSPMQSGPTCGSLAYMGADCIKVERPGVGDITRDSCATKRADSPGLHDAQRQQALDHDRQQESEGHGNPRPADQAMRRVVENFAPGALDRMGLTGSTSKDQPAHDRRLGEGLRPGPYEAYENVAQCPAAPPRPPASARACRRHRRADRRSALAVSAFGIVGVYQRTRTGRGQKACAMQDGVLNLARVSCATSSGSRMGHARKVWRGASLGRRRRQRPGGGQPLDSAQGLEMIPTPTSISSPRRRLGRSAIDRCSSGNRCRLRHTPGPAAASAHLQHHRRWTMTMTKFEVMETCNKHDIPVGPILSMKEIAENVARTGTVVEVDSSGRGKHLTVGNPVRCRPTTRQRRRYWASTPRRS